MVRNKQRLRFSLATLFIAMTLTAVLVAIGVRSPILLGVMGIAITCLLIMIGACRIAPKLSRWHQLAVRYATHRVPWKGSVIRGSGRVNGVRYIDCLVTQSRPDGIVILAHRLCHRTLFIPWSDITVEHEAVRCLSVDVFSKFAAIIVAGPPRTRMMLPAGVLKCRPASDRAQERRSSDAFKEALAYWTVGDQRRARDKANDVLQHAIETDVSVCQAIDQVICRETLPIEARVQRVLRNLLLVVTFAGLMGGLVGWYAVQER
jgi:hypothetical protein